MSKRLFLLLLEVLAGVLGNLIAGWIQQDRWANIFSPTRLIGTFVGLIFVIIIVSLLDSDNEFWLSWHWHRYWYLYSLVYNSRLNHWAIDYAELDISEVQREHLTVDVVVAGERRNLIEVLAHNVIDVRNVTTRILVLGEPGSGKTTSLERLSLQIAARGLRNFGFNSKIPVLARLGDFQRTDLVSFITQSLAHEVHGMSGRILGKHIDSLLEKGRIILLLDALDEALGETREEIVKGLRTFISSEAFSQTPIVITARTHQDPRSGLPGVQVYEIQDLDDISVNAFIEIYRNPLSIPEFVWQDLKDGDLLGRNGMGRNPFWLRLIITSEIFEPIQSILLEKAINSLLEREWDKPETNRSWTRLIPREEQLTITKNALADFSFLMSLNKKLFSTRDFAEKTLAQWLISKSIDDEIKPRDILGLGRDAQILTYRMEPTQFRHRLIQEYLAAYSMVQKEHVATLEFVDQHVYDTDWWVIFQLFSGLTPYPAELIGTILGDSTDKMRLLLTLILLSNMNDSQHAEFDVAKGFLTEFQDNVPKEEVKVIFDAMRNMGGDIIRVFSRFIEFDNSVVRKGAINILAELSYPEVIEIFISFLNSPILVDDISDALAYIGKPTIPALILGLMNRNEDLARGAALALGKLGDLSVTPLSDYLAQTKILITSDVTITEQKTFEQIWNQVLSEQETLEHWGRGPYWAIRALGKTRSDAANEILIKALHSADFQIHRAAIDALSDFGEGVTRSLLVQLRDLDESVREGSAIALGNIADRVAVPSLVTALDDTSPLVRTAAVYALAKIGDSSIVLSLIPLLYDSYTNVHSAVVDAVKALVSDSYEIFFKVFSESDDKDIYRVAAALVATNQQQVRAFLDSALNDPERRTRLKAIVVLQVMDSVDSFIYLNSLLIDDDREVQVAALDAFYQKSMKKIQPLPIFEELHTEKLIRSLTTLSIDSNQGIRDQAIKILIKLPDDRAITPLLKIFKTASASLRLEILRSLRWKKDSRIKKFIQGCLYDPNPRISDAAIETIGLSGDSDDIPILQSLHANSSKKQDQIDNAVEDIRRRAK